MWQKWRLTNAQGELTIEDILTSAGIHLRIRSKLGERKQMQGMHVGGVHRGNRGGTKEGHACLMYCRGDPLKGATTGTNYAKLQEGSTESTKEGHTRVS